MPGSLRVCADPRCPVLTRSTYCQTHNPRRAYQNAGYWRAYRRGKRYQGSPCSECGEPMQSVTVGHKVPITRGGTSHESNLQYECWDCNRAKVNQ